MKPKFRLAVFFQTSDTSPPSNLRTLEYFQEVAKGQNILVEIVGPEDFHRLSEFDCLWLRSPADKGTDAYLAACYALQEGKPVIDDPLSILQATDKVYMQGLMGHVGVPLPDSRGITRNTNLLRLVVSLGLPIVLKLPDSYYSKGVFKAQSLEEVISLTTKLFQQNGLLLAQEYLPTKYDWRVGVLDNEPLFVCQYHMVEGHWQIVKHNSDGTAIEGPHKTVPLKEAPPEVVNAALLAASCVGDGLYGVDVKTTETKGVVVIEVNDNPNLEHGIEDEFDTDVWSKLLQWFDRRLRSL